MTVRIAKQLSLSFLLLPGCGPKLPVKPDPARSLDVSIGDAHSVLYSVVHEYLSPKTPRSFLMDGSGLIQEVTLTSVYEPATAEFKQIYRDIVEESFRQESLDYYDDILSKDFRYENNFANSEDLKIKVDDIEVPRENVFMEKDAKKMKFKKAPPERAIIHISDHVDEPLPAVFPIGEKAGRKVSKAFVNGEEVKGAEIDPRTGKLIFAKPPRDGAKIDVDYNKIVAPILDYEFTTAAMEPLIQEAVDAETGEAISLTLSENKLVLDDESHIDGRKLWVRYADGDLAPNQFRLNQDPNAQYAIKSKDKTCAKEGNIRLEAGVLTVNCDFLEPTAFTIELLKKPEVRFTVPEVDHIGAWRVFINGMPIDEFHLDGQEIVIDRDIPAGAKIEISFVT